MPWLEAVGYERVKPDEDLTADASEEELSIWAQQVYRLLVFRERQKRRNSRTHRLEVRGDQTLGELDVEIRMAFGHDTFDHLSEFSVPAAGRRGHGMKGLGPLYPDGGGEGNDILVGSLKLEPGDELLYVYDFGDWLEHTARVEAIVPPEAGVEYPREV